MPAKQGNIEWIAGAQGQEMIFNSYFSRLQLLAMSTYEWAGLPSTCNHRFLEQVLHQDGRACIVNTDSFGFLNLRCSPNGSLNFYEDYTGYNCWSIGITEYRDSGECVFIRNNWLEQSTYPALTHFARKLTDIERTIIINIHAQNTPILIRASKDTELTLRNLYMKYDGYIPAIYVDKSLDIDSLSVLRTDAPYLADKLHAEKMNTWREALTYLGISNNMDFKRAQVNSEEIEHDAEHYAFMSESGLVARQQACIDAKRIFGLDITVRRRDVSELMGGGDNGGIYYPIENAD